MVNWQWSHPSAVNLLLLSFCFMKNPLIFPHHQDRKPQTHYKTDSLNYHAFKKKKKNLPVMCICLCCRNKESTFSRQKQSNQTAYDLFRLCFLFPGLFQLTYIITWLSLTQFFSGEVHIAGRRDSSFGLFCFAHLI